MQWLLLTLIGSPVARVGDSCKTSLLLPAYAHNDYRNRRPLRDALALGFRGAEADVFRVGKELVVGHDRQELRPARTLAQLYLEPLRTRHQACGYVLSDSTPFFLNIELKEEDSEAFRLLLLELGGFEELFRSQGYARRPAVQVTLVGWWPDTDVTGWPSYLRAQVAVGRDGPARPKHAAPVGLVSLDYGKVLGWSGRGSVPRSVAATLAAARELAESLAVPVRVHHAPVDDAVYEWLLSQGVALIGTTDLERTRAGLERILASRPPQ